MKETIRERLAAIIARDLAIDVRPHELCLNRGSNKWNDWCKWTAEAHRMEDRRSCHLASWVTMTELVKAGNVGVVDDNGYTIEIA